MFISTTIIGRTNGRLVDLPDEIWDKYILRLSGLIDVVRFCLAFPDKIEDKLPAKIKSMFLNILQDTYFSFIDNNYHIYR